MLDETTTAQVNAYFSQHPVLGRYSAEVCIALTGSFAVGLGGQGADVDLIVLCPPTLYDPIRRELAAMGRIRAGDAPEEELTDLVGDYTLASLSAVWQQVQAYADITALFIYGNLVYMSGNRDLLDPLVSHCRNLPPTVLERETDCERGAMDQHLYAFLRSFQNADPVARMLARSGMVRAAMRLAFLAAGAAPPYDKHLFRLLARLPAGHEVAELINRFLSESGDGSYEAAAYAGVAASRDWHEMYAVAARTPAVGFRDAVLRLTHLG